MTAEVEVVPLRSFRTGGNWVGPKSGPVKVPGGEAAELIRKGWAAAKTPPRGRAKAAEKPSADGDGG